MNIKRSILVLLIFTVILGFLYTGFITLIAQTFFKNQANGDLAKKGGQVVGSYKIGQEFKDLGHFWSRPSTTNYESSDKLEDYLKQTSENTKDVPDDLITVSASGVEAYISKEAAYYQIERIQKHTGLSEELIKDVIDSNIEKTFESEIVNVLQMNLELDLLRGE